MYLITCNDRIPRERKCYFASVDVCVVQFNDQKKKGCGGEVLNISGKNLSAEDDLFRRPA